MIIKMKRNTNTGNQTCTPTGLIEQPEVYYDEIKNIEKFDEYIRILFRNGDEISYTTYEKTETSGTYFYDYIYLMNDKGQTIERII